MPFNAKNKEKRHDRTVGVVFAFYSTVLAAKKRITFDKVFIPLCRVPLRFADACR